MRLPNSRWCSTSSKKIMHAWCLKKVEAAWEERRLASAFGSFSEPQKCIIFLENIGTLSSIWFRTLHEKVKLFTPEKGQFKSQLCVSACWKARLVPIACIQQLHSRPQSLRSPWPAVGKREVWEQSFQACAIDADCPVKPNGQNSVIFFVISKWLLPELSIPAAGQKDRRLWGRKCSSYI